MHLTLRDLKLVFQVRYMEDRSPTPWKDLFARIKDALCFEKLVIDVDDHHYEASGGDEIEALSAWMKGNMPVNSNEESSTDED